MLLRFCVASVSVRFRSPRFAVQKFGGRRPSHGNRKCSPPQSQRPLMAASCGFLISSCCLWSCDPGPQECGVAGEQTSIDSHTHFPDYPKWHLRQTPDCMPLGIVTIQRMQSSWPSASFPLHMSTLLLFSLQVSQASDQTCNLNATSLNKQGHPLTIDFKHKGPYSMENIKYF